MALQKSKVSTRTGVTLGYHSVMNIGFSTDRADVVVASYADSAAKVAGKSPAEITPYQFPYAGEVFAKSANDFAEDLLLTHADFSGATKVA